MEHDWEFAPGDPEPDIDDWICKNCGTWKETIYPEHHGYYSFCERYGSATMYWNDFVDFYTPDEPNCSETLLQEVLK